MKRPVPPRITKADRMRKAREHAGLDQSQLAQMIGVSRMTISNLETEKTRPTTDVIARWAAATNTPIDWIESGRRQGFAHYDE